MRRRTSAAGNSRGFTLIESLIALAILGVIVSVLVRTHLQALRSGEFSRLHGQAVLETETILTGSMLGNERQAIMDEARKQGWRVDAGRIGEPGAPVFTEWRVAVSNPAAPVVVMVLRGDSDAGKTNQASETAP